MISISDFFGYTAVIVALITNIYALNRIRLGIIRPHAFSVFIWFIITTVAFVNMLEQNVDAAAYRTGLMAALIFINFCYCIRNGFGYVLKSDIILLVLALTTIPIWIITKNPNVAMFWLLFIEILAIIPTIRKAYALPFEMSASVYAFTALAQGLQFLSLTISPTPHSLAIMLYMGIFPIIFSLLAGLLFYLQKTKP